jgi:hypothetical protein
MIIQIKNPAFIETIIYVILFKYPKESPNYSLFQAVDEMMQEKMSQVIIENGLIKLFRGD